MEENENIKEAAHDTNHLNKMDKGKESEEELARSPNMAEDILETKQKENLNEDPKKNTFTVRSKDELEVLSNLDVHKELPQRLPKVLSLSNLHSYSVTHLDGENGSPY